MGVGLEIDVEKLEKVISEAPVRLNEKQEAFIRHFVLSGGHSVLQGVAGAGKSLLMSLLKKYYGDEIVFLGSTGVAAQNLINGIGIGTAHSYLSLPTDLATEFNYKKVYSKCSNLFAKSSLVKIIVIDEAFLLNSDNLDVIWRRIQRFNRKTRNRDTRDIRLLLVGDSAQAVTIANKKMKQDLKERWGSHLMFRSSVWERFDFTYYVLDKVERQEDKVFKACLDVIRYNQKSRFPKCLEWLNKRVTKEDTGDYITLAATNKTVDRINKEVINRNLNPKIEFTPMIWGQFNIKDTIVRPEGYILCKDLKVMTIVNDPDGRWSNGSTGMTKMVTTEGCYVKFDHSGEEHFVPLYEWENKEISVEKVVDGSGNVVEKLKEDTIGGMVCSQVVPASALTISKSQGLTLSEKYFIDFEDDWLYTWDKMEDLGTNFLYLGLSRGVSVDLINLIRPITFKHIKNCQESIDFWFECCKRSVI